MTFRVQVELIPPVEVVDDLLENVFKVKRFFDASFALVLVMTTVFLVLVMILTWKLPQRERETLVRIGCARATVARLQAAELALLLLASTVLAGLGAWGLLALIRHGAFLLS